MKAFISIVAIAAVIVGFSACERVGIMTQPTSYDVTDKSISIGVVLPLTGRLAATGELVKQGFDLALGEINNKQLGGPQFTFIIEDDTSTPEGAAAAFNKLIHEDGVSVILGPVTSSAAEVAFPIAGENQVVAISPTSSKRGLSAISDFVFRVALATDVVVAKGVEVTYAKLGYQRVATMYDDTDGFSTDRDEALREALTAKGVEVLTTEPFQGGATDFSAQLTRIQALNPDAIFVSALPPEKPGILVQADELGISVPFIVSSLTHVEVAAAGASAEGAITFLAQLSTDDTSGNQGFLKRYSAAYGIEPNVFGASSYTTLYLLAEALKTAQSTDSAAIRDALANISDFDTVLGQFSFNADGDAVYEPGVLVVKDGMLQPFGE